MRLAGIVKVENAHDALAAHDCARAQMQMPGKKEIKKQEGKPQQEEQREEKQEGKLQQEEQRKEKQEGKLQQEERGREFVRLRLTPHGIDVSNQVFVDFML